MCCMCAFRTLLHRKDGIEGGGKKFIQQRGEHRLMVTDSSKNILGHREVVLRPGALL